MGNINYIECFNLNLSNYCSLTMVYIKVKYISNCYSREGYGLFLESIFIGYIYRMLEIAGFPHF